MNKDLYFIQKFSTQGLSKEDIDLIALMLKEKSESGEIYSTLLHILGVVGAIEYRELVESYLHNPPYAHCGAQALSTLCNYWGLTTEYLSEIKKIIKGIEWDDSDQGRFMAIPIAGRYLRDYFDRELLQLLLDLFENLGTNDALLDRSDSTRPLLQSFAYIVLARAMGYDWEDIPDTEVIKEIILEKQFQYLDMVMIEKAHEMVRTANKQENKTTNPTQTMIVRKDLMIEQDYFRNKLQTQGVFKEDVDLIALILKEKIECGEMPSTLVHILGVIDASEHRELVETYLYNPPYAYCGAQALSTLCNYWELTTEYLPEIKTIIKGVAWDDTDDARMIALSIAGTYLSGYFDKELVQLLLDLFENLGTSDVLLDRGECYRPLIQSCVYKALAEAMGYDWEDIPDIEDIEELISEKQYQHLDLLMIEKAHELVRAAEQSRK